MNGGIVDLDDLPHFVDREAVRPPLHLRHDDPRFLRLRLLRYAQALA